MWYPWIRPPPAAADAARVFYIQYARAALFVCARCFGALWLVFFARVFVDRKEKPRSKWSVGGLAGGLRSPSGLLGRYVSVGGACVCAMAA